MREAQSERDEAASEAIKTERDRDQTRMRCWDVQKKNKELQVPSLHHIS